MTHLHQALTLSPGKQEDAQYTIRGYVLLAIERLKLKLNTFGGRGMPDLTIRTKLKSKCHAGLEFCVAQQQLLSHSRSFMSKNITKGKPKGRAPKAFPSGKVFTKDRPANPTHCWGTGRPSVNTAGIALFMYFDCTLAKSKQI